MKTANDEPDQSFQDKLKRPGLHQCARARSIISAVSSVQRSVVDNIKIEMIETKET